MSTEDIVDGLAIIQQKRGRIVDQGDVEMLALAIRALRKLEKGSIVEDAVVVPKELAKQVARHFAVCVSALAGQDNTRPELLVQEARPIRTRFQKLLAAAEEQPK